MTIREKVNELVSWSIDKVADVEALEALKKALEAPSTRALPTGTTTDAPPTSLLVGKKAREAIDTECEAHDGEKLARRYARVVSKLTIAPGDLLVLHVPDWLTEKQFNRISAVMNTLITKKYPDICYIVLPEVVSFGKTIRTRMPRADVEEQLRSLLGVLMADDEPIVREKEGGDGEED